MSEIDVLEARTHLPRLLQRVQAGESSSSLGTIVRWPS